MVETSYLIYGLQYFFCSLELKESQAIFCAGASGSSFFCLDFCFADGETRVSENEIRFLFLEIFRTFLTDI